VVAQRKSTDQRTESLIVESNVTLTLTRGIHPVDTADVAKNNIFLSQRGKFQFQNPKSHSHLLYFHSLSLPVSQFLTPSLFTLHSLHSHSLVQWRYLSLSLRPLSGSLDLYVLSRSLRSSSQQKVGFLFRLCWKSI